MSSSSSSVRGAGSGIRYKKFPSKLNVQFLVNPRSIPESLSEYTKFDDVQFYSTLKHLALPPTLSIESARDNSKRLQICDAELVGGVFAFSEAARIVFYILVSSGLAEPTLRCYDVAIELTLFQRQEVFCGKTRGPEGQNGGGSLHCQSKEFGLQR